MNNLRILPYAMGSDSAKSLATHLNCLRVHSDGNYVPRMQQSVINWGCSQPPTWSQRAHLRGVRILNKPSAVRLASNKLTTLTELRRAGIAVPDFTIDRYTAQAWLDQGHIVFERHTLTGNSGAGIQIVSRENDPEDPSTIRNYLTPAPLYTKYVPKTTEFRVHVFKGEVIDYIEKKKVARDRRPDNFNPYISSVNMGWVFCRSGIMDSESVRATAVNAVRSLGLDFGAVDIAYAEGLSYVLEVNTAPGLNGTTLVKYVNAFKRHMGAAPLSQNQIDLILSQARESDDSLPAAQAHQTGSSEPVQSATVAIPNSEPRRANDGEVLLRLDRPTALKLKHLLSNIV